MRLLHTSDWHLGRGLHGYSLAGAQQQVLDALVDLAIEREVDAVIIAGDVYDRTYPGIDDVRMLRATLTRFHEAGIPIVCTAGNHDEGARLAAFGDLLDDTVTVIGEYSQVGQVVLLADQHGPVAVYPLPYLHPDGARHALSPSGEDLLPRTHEAVIGEALRRVRADLAARREADPSTRAVVVSHAFVVRGSETPDELHGEQSESERDIAVGGVPSAPTAVYDGVHYVALGHLHGPRTVQEQSLPDGRPLIRYSGSPLRYSLSEADHEKSATIVDLDADGTCTIDVVPLPQPAGMARLRGSLDELLSGAYAQHRNDFVELTLTDRQLPDTYLAQVKEHFPLFLRARTDRGDGPARLDQATAAPTHTVTPLETLRSFYVAAREEEPTEGMESILRSVLERANESLRP